MKVIRPFKFLSDIKENTKKLEKVHDEIFPSSSHWQGLYNSILWGTSNDTKSEIEKLVAEIRHDPRIEFVAKPVKWKVFQLFKTTQTAEKQEMEKLIEPIQEKLFFSLGIFQDASGPDRSARR